MTKPLLPLLIAAAALLGACSTGASSAVDTTVPQETAAAAQAVETTDESTADDSGARYAVADDSEVRFYIFELFRGEPLVVEGVNTGIAGSVVVNGDQITLTPFVVDAAGFVTERGEAPSPLGEEVGWRDEAIDRFILDVSDHPEIIFTPDPGQDIELGDGRLAGILTVRDIPSPVVFDVTISETPDGWAVAGSTEVLRSTFGLTLPNVAHVAEVAEEVTLELDLFFAGPSA